MSARFGRRKAVVKKTKQHARPGAVKMEMYAPDASGPTLGKSSWQTIPDERFSSIENYVRTHNLEGESLSYILVHMWGRRIVLTKALKLAFIAGMQECVRMSYGKLPSWFSNKIRLRTSETIFDKYYSNACRVLMCMILYKDDGVQDGVSRAAGHLIEYGSENPSNPNKIKFKSESQLKNECLPYGNRKFSSVHDIYTMLKNVDTDPRLQGNICVAELKRIGELMREILEKDRSVEFLLYGGYISSPAEVQPQMKAMLQQARMDERQRRRESTRRAAQLRKQNALDAANTFLDPPKPVGGNVPRPERGGRVFNPVRVATNMAKAMEKPKNREDLLKRAQQNVDEALELAKKNDFGRRHSRRYRNAHGFGGKWSATTVPFTGYVRPYKTSAMESYTGFTPRMYRRHIMSKTGSAPGLRRARNLSAANSYYGGYRLGEKLNPTSKYGRRRKSRKKGPKRRKSKSRKSSYGRKFFF